VASKLVRRLHSDDWPVRLADVDPAPAELYLTGQLPPEPAVAIVGTRHPSEAGVAFAAQLAGDLARAGLCVVSGGAEGIDAAAHQGALEAGGSTLVVAPAGFLRPFPAEHAELFQRVVDAGGGYLSLCPADQPAQQFRFFQRNACLVALSHVLVVVEAGYRSGARNAAKHARLLGRKLFVVPSAPWIASGRGCLLELRAGASLLVSARDVLRYLAQIHVHGMQRQLALPLTAPNSELGDQSAPEVRVLDALRAGARNADAVCEATGLDFSEVQRELFSLRLAGAVRVDASGAICLLAP